MIRELVPQPYLGKRFRTLTTEDVGRGVSTAYLTGPQEASPDQQVTEMVWPIG